MNTAQKACSHLTWTIHMERNTLAHAFGKMINTNVKQKRSKA
jgi:hypothetical protein